MRRHSTHPIYPPGSPWKNGCNERFNRTPRHEFRNAERFAPIEQIQVVIQNVTPALQSHSLATRARHPAAGI